ncbi:hypothetical protein EPO15_15265 [bacterium]|nr:MAG: hypothetical protein EPO15_15265 [bacterium]
MVQAADAYPAVSPDEAAARRDSARLAYAAQCVGLIAEAKGQGALAVCLGQACLGPYPEDPGLPELSPPMRVLRKAAYENSVVVVAPLKDMTFFVDGQGLVLGRPGSDRMESLETSLGRIGVVSGHGARENAAVAALAAGGAQIVFIPGAAPAGETREAWEARYPRVAADHKVHIGALNPLGGGRFGASYFCGPTGIRLRNLSKNPDLVVSDLELPD